MATVTCPAPNCQEAFPDDLYSAVLLRLLDIHAATAHPPAIAQAAVQPQAAAHLQKAEKVRRPCITLAGNSEDWSYFLPTWTEYKRDTNLQNH